MSWDSPPPDDDAPTAPPEWFEWALAQAPERSSVLHDGAAIETLSWGRRGAPGLLLMHGNSACADWWRFIAPFFGADYRVMAFSWSGMGRSDHRDSYSFDCFADEMFAVAEASGLYEGGPPLAVGHSFGGYAMMCGAQREAGAGFRGAVIVDTPFTEVGEPNRHRPPPGVYRPHRPHASLDHAVARFRLMPPQLCDNEFLTDYIARQSVVEAAADGGEAGWIWRFDPNLMTRMESDDADRDLLANPRCPVALLWGDRSALMPPERVALMRARLPAGAPAVAIPDADHHVMLDQPLAFVAALRGLFASWPASAAVRA